MNKAAAEWLYRADGLNEPWVFLVGSDGRIAARFDNVVTQDELEAGIRHLRQSIPLRGGRPTSKVLGGMGRVPLGVGGR